MEQSSSWDEWTVRHQFDRICKLALKGEVIDYQKTYGLSAKARSAVVRIAGKGVEQTFYNG